MAAHLCNPKAVVMFLSHMISKTDVKHSPCDVCFNTQSERPNKLSRRSIIIPRSVISNVAHRSKRTKTESLFSSEFSQRLLIILVRAGSVLWYVLKPDRNSSRTETIFASILLMNGRLDISLQLVSASPSWSGFFSEGFITAVLKASGKKPVFEEMYL